MAEALTSDTLAGVPHGFMTRRGGRSQGIVSGLNCGYGADDDPAVVAENRHQAAEAVLPGATLLGLFQIHSPDVVTVDNPWREDSRPRADALVTSRPMVLLGIVTADCAPVLLADRQAGVIGAAHAGWRGARGGVIENTVDAMEALGADRTRISAAVGPCIARASYEVDDGFRDQFSTADERFFGSGKPGHWQFDLPGYVLSRLAACGVADAAWIARDTYADEGAFYSFRRATHRGEPNYGRQLSLIGLNGTDRTGV